MSSKMGEVKKVGCLTGQPCSLESKERSEPLDSGYFSPYHCCTCQNAEKLRSNGQSCRSLHHATITFCFDQAPTLKSCQYSLYQNEKNSNIDRKELKIVPILQYEEDLPNISRPNPFGATPVGMFPIIPLITRLRALWLRANCVYHPPSGFSSNDVVLIHNSKLEHDTNSPTGQDCEVTYNNANPNIQCQISTTRSSVATERRNSHHQQQTDVTCWNIGAVNVEAGPTGAATIELSRPDKSALYVRRHATKSPLHEGQVSPPPPATQLDFLPRKGAQVDKIDAQVITGGHSTAARRCSRRRRPSSLHIHHDPEVVRHVAFRASRNNRPSNGLSTGSNDREVINRRRGAVVDECLAVGIQLRNLGDDFEMFLVSGTVSGPVSLSSGTPGFCKVLGKAIFGALRVLLNLDVV